LPEVKAEVTGTVWKITCAVGDAVAAGQTVLIIESMKMEIPLEEGQPVNDGDVMVVLT
jgi:acetyl-CoA carboxylase biotin carboxyl carrier protein